MFALDDETEEIEESTEERDVLHDANDKSSLSFMKQPTSWRSCWSSLGEDAREAATRASVDYAGRVVEPFLRRADVERQRRNKKDADDAVAR